MATADALPQDGPVPGAAGRARGKARRREVPRASHAGHPPLAPDRDVLGMLERSAEGRIGELLPLRWQRMSASAFAFFRGTADVQAADLAATPRVGPMQQVCGDAHLGNFGLFATPERDLIFGPNDFDETSLGWWEWDLKRLAASAVLAARHRGLSASAGTDLVRTLVASYARRIDEYSRMHVLDVWASRIRAEEQVGQLDGAVRERAQAVVSRARRRTSDQVFQKLVRSVDGQARFVDDPPRIFHHGPDAAFAAKCGEVFARYRTTLADDRRMLFDRFSLVDFAVKVVGVGSVGRHCVMALLQSESGQPLILQIKEAATSVLEPWCGPARETHPGHRVVTGQRLMQAFSDPFLGWASDDEGRHYYVRQMQDMKGGVDLDTISPAGLAPYLVLCGWALARAHAKSGNGGADIAGYVGKGDSLGDALALYAVAYADQAEADHAAFVAAIRAGRFSTEVTFRPERIAA
ncbi:MAG: DUF2252 domain-containing protein [Burkholderiales bacterium]|jgi:uncharacterized protein (DUF2252 family)|nr:DUF2252 domain-containing protein [Burkholderiales bacterium]